MISFSGYFFFIISIFKNFHFLSKRIFRKEYIKNGKPIEIVYVYILQCFSLLITMFIFFYIKKRRRKIFKKKILFIDYYITLMKKMKKKNRIFNIQLLKSHSLFFIYIMRMNLNLYSTYKLLFFAFFFFYYWIITLLIKNTY